MDRGLSFGPITLVPVERVLLKDGRPVALTPKAFDLLAYLAENPERLLTKEELMRAVWPDAIVEESNLASNVFAIRKALGEAADGQRYIETVPKRGYRFVAPVVPHPADAPSPLDSAGGPGTSDQAGRALDRESVPILRRGLHVAAGIALGALATAMLTPSRATRSAMSSPTYFQETAWVATSARESARFTRSTVRCGRSRSRPTADISPSAWLATTS